MTVGGSGSGSEVAAGAAPPAMPRAAATVVLLRPGPAGLEALLAHRPPTMAFAPDVHAFPGGRVEVDDADPTMVARSIRSPAACAAALGDDLEPAAALATHVAAIRELFEEAGVLLAEAPGRALGRDRLARARSDLLAGSTTFAAIADALDLQLWTDRLLPLSRWVTPPTMPRRFDTRFFAAALPDRAEATLVGDEVAAHDWLRPADALDAMADGRLSMWLPTSTTLQQLEHASSIEDIGSRLAPGRLGRPQVERVSGEVLRIEMPAGGGVAGQPINAYLVGHRRFVLIDPGDPTGPGLDLALELATTAGGALAAVALTHVDPDHAAGAEAIAERTRVRVMVGPGGDRRVPYTPVVLDDGDIIHAGDVPLRVVATPGPRRDHLAFVEPGDGLAFAGDLDGRRGARSILGAVDADALRASRRRLQAMVPEDRWLGGHPRPDDDPDRPAP